MLNNISSIYLSSIIIFILSIIFAILVGSGLYGLGIDYWSAYYKPNLTWGGVFDVFGYRLATFSIYGVHLGVHITTFILSLSVGFLIRENLKSNSIYSLFLFLSLYLIVIHTWPIIMSTSNAMRQGMTMSFIFLAISLSENKNYLWALIFCFIATFVHKSGLFLSAIVVLAVILSSILRNFKEKRRLLLYFLIGISCSALFNFIIPIYLDIEGPSKIIEGDFRAAFLLISLTYIFLTLFFKKLTTGAMHLSVFFYSFISIPILIQGLNWEYERLGMMMLIPYILSFGAIFDKPSKKLYLLIALIALFLLTLYTGMYKFGLTSHEEYCLSVQNAKIHCVRGFN